MCIRDSGLTGGKRDFASATSIVAGHYDVLCEPDSAPQARDMIAAAAQNRAPGAAAGDAPQQ